VKIMNKKNLNPKNTKPVIRNNSINLPQLHEEQLAGGLGDRNAIAPQGLTRVWERCGGCSFDGDDAE